MSASQLSFSRAVDTLAHFYGEPEAPRITDPFAMVVWENIAYLANDARRAEAFEELRKKIGLRPSDIRKASDKDLLSVTSKGIVPNVSLEKLRNAAQIAKKLSADDLSSVLGVCREYRITSLTFTVRAALGSGKIGSRKRVHLIGCQSFRCPMQL